jgi:hypothetical protein
MTKEQIGYTIECPCCGGLMINSADPEGEVDAHFKIYLTKEDALKAAVSCFEEETGEMLNKIKRVKIIYEYDINNANKEGTNGNARFIPNGPED